MLNSGCEGYCRGGPAHPSRCRFNFECPESDCVGGDNPAHANACQCECMRETGSGPAASFSCEMGMTAVLEADPPCGGGDVTLRISEQCVPITTGVLTNLFFDANLVSGVTLGPTATPGASAPSCSALALGQASGATLAGNAAGIDGATGDQSVPVVQVCK